jgi:hypothetical protein
MKVLFAGDSITRGTQGVDWVKMIEKNHPYWTMENIAVNGETLNKISDRLEKHLEKSFDYHAVVLQSVTNEILLPLFKHRGFWFRQAYRHQLLSGNRPASPAEFESKLIDTIEYIQKKGNIQIILPTIACLQKPMPYFSAITASC